MIDYPQALSLLRQTVAPLDMQWVDSTQALGRVLACAVNSEAWLPPFDNSSMDGFALDTAGQGLPEGTQIAVRGWQAAGDTQQRAQGGAWEIMTGARMPEGLDAVVPVEQVEVLAQADGRPTSIRLRHAVEPGQYVRCRGADLAAGHEVIAAGTVVRAQESMLLAALGVAAVQVRRKPRVAVIATGHELVSDPAQPLQSGQIRDSNRPFLLAQLQTAGAEVIWHGVVGDEPGPFQQALDQVLGLGADVILSTGAVSEGRYDFIPDALRARGARIVFHKVAVRPGKPVLFATLDEGPLYFGLPGNPASTAMGLRFFVEPALRGMFGQAPEVPLRIPLKADFDKVPALRFHARAWVGRNAAGELDVAILPGQESFRLMPMLQANAWAVIPEGRSSVARGELVDVYGLGHWQPVPLFPESNS
ncbi:MAG: molybdopterin molybdotransferase MoeA [Pseudomonas sp.]